MTRRTPLRILCILPAVTGGGAERVFLDFLRNVDRNTFIPHVVLLYTGGDFEHEIPDDIPISYLSGRLRQFGVLRHFDRILAIFLLSLRIGRFDAVISFGSLFNGFVVLSSCLARFRGPLILIEAIQQSSVDTGSRLVKRLRSLFLRATYPRATSVIAVSEGVAEDLRRIYGISSNVEVIPNGLDLSYIRKEGEALLVHPWFSDREGTRTLVAVGRLVKQKGFCHLIRAMALLPSHVRLVLVGDGEERAYLESLAAELGVQDRIYFAGYDRNPFRYMARADIFVMPSIFEGFGLVLVEALALGVPIVATDCRSGPAEILDRGVYGRLVPVADAEALARATEGLLDDPAELNRLRQFGESRAEMFSLDRSLRAYENLLLGCQRP